MKQKKCHETNNGNKMEKRATPLTIHDLLKMKFWGKEKIGSLHGFVFLTTEKRFMQRKKGL